MRPLCSQTAYIFLLQLSFSKLEKRVEDYQRHDRGGPWLTQVFSGSIRWRLTSVKKAQKSQATRNAQKLLLTHSITVTLHVLFNLRRLFLSSSSSRSSLTLYLTLAFPALLIEAYLEKLGRPSHGDNGAVRKSGDDLDAKGLMEWMWDILYWTWISLGFVTVVGDWGWWLWVCYPRSWT
jgi:hypothetical protein